jgi:hypothetical protein
MLANNGGNYDNLEDGGRRGSAAGNDLELTDKRTGSPVRRTAGGNRKSEISQFAPYEWEQRVSSP